MGGKQAEPRGVELTLATVPCLLLLPLLSAYWCLTSDSVVCLSLFPALGFQIVKLLNRMQLPSTLKEDKSLLVTVPPTRSDVLHPCDVMEVCPHRAHTLSPEPYWHTGPQEEVSKPRCAH